MGDFVTATCHFPLLRRRDVVGGFIPDSKVQHDPDKECRSEHNGIVLTSKIKRRQPCNGTNPNTRSRGALDRAPWQVIAALPTGGVAPEPAPFLNQSRHTSCTHEARAPRQVRHPVVSPAPPIALTQPPKGGAHGAQHVPPRPTTPGVFQHHSIQGDPSGASRCRGNGGDATASGTSSTAARPWVATEGLRKCSTRQTPGGQVVFAAGQTPWCPLAPALVSPSRAARAPPGAWGSARAPSCCSARPCRWPAPGWPASWTYWRSSLRRAPSEMFAVRCMCCTASKLSFNSASVASIFSQLSHSSQPAVV